VNALETQAAGTTREEAYDDEPLVWHYVPKTKILECQVCETVVLALCGQEIRAHFAFDHDGSEFGRDPVGDVICEYCARLNANLAAR
jgi:hypothetical protein